MEISYISGRQKSLLWGDKPKGCKQHSSGKLKFSSSQANAHSALPSQPTLSYRVGVIVFVQPSAVIPRCVATLTVAMRLSPCAALSPQLNLSCFHRSFASFTASRTLSPAAPLPKAVNDLFLYSFYSISENLYITLQKKRNDK